MRNEQARKLSVLMIVNLRFCRNTFFIGQLSPVQYTWLFNAADSILIKLTAQRKKKVFCCLWDMVLDSPARLDFMVFLSKIP